jgi:hypothetical protein
VPREVEKKITEITELTEASLFPSIPLFKFVPLSLRVFQAKVFDSLGSYFLETQIAIPVVEE